MRAELGDPYPLARFVPVNLGDEILHLSLLTQDGLEFAAPLGVNVPFRCDVVHAMQHLGFTVIAVHPHQRPVGAQLPSFERGPVDAFIEVIDEFRAIELVSDRGAITTLIAQQDQEKRHEQDNIG